MKMDRHFSRRCTTLTALLALLLLAAGCTRPGSYSSAPAPPQETVLSQDPQRPVEEVQTEIDRTRRHIEDLREYETQQRQIGVINQVEHDRTRGWVKLDGHPTYEEVADQSYAQAAATEKEIARLEKKVAELEREKQTILKESRGCFPAEAQVLLADGTSKSFKDITSGDLVLTYDIGYDAVVGRPVKERYQVAANHLYTINGQLTTTGGERLLTPAGWKKVRDLKMGDAVHVDGRMISIASITYQRVTPTLYNLQVADTHNFYVLTTGGDAYLVHNSSGGGGGGGSGK